LLRDHTKLIRRAVTSADVLVSALLFVGLLSLPDLHRSTGGTRPEEWRLLAAGLVGTLTCAIVADQFGLYDSLRRNSITEIITRLAIAAAIATAVLMGVMFVVAAPLARRFPFIFGLSQLLSLGALRFFVVMVLHTLRRSGRNYRDVLIAGTGKRQLMGLADRLEAAGCAPGRGAARQLLTDRYPSRQSLVSAEDSNHSARPERWAREPV
jgi:FlaA1/EpsC-like NDP-sugar epimerase